MEVARGLQEDGLPPGGLLLQWSGQEAAATFVFQLFSGWYWGELHAIVCLTLLGSLTGFSTANLISFLSRQNFGWNFVLLRVGVPVVS